jgi:hypothetical protein
MLAGAAFVMRAFRHENPRRVKGWPAQLSSALEMTSMASHNGTATQRRNGPMPTLFRFLVTLGILAGLAYAAMFALVTFVEPKKGEISIRIPADKINPAQ